MASPPQTGFVVFDDFNSTEVSSQVACYDYNDDVISTIGEGLFINATAKIPTPFPNELRNFTEQYSGGGAVTTPFGFLPHLLMVIVLIVTLSRALHFLLRPLKQPLIICQIIAGFLIFLFWNKNKYDDYSKENLIIWPNNRRLEDAIALVGLLLNLFLASLKMDVSTVWRSGSKPVIMGLAGFLVPLTVVCLVYAFLYNILNPFVENKEKFLFFIAVLLCSSNFPVLADILSELQLLNSELGRLALSSSMIQNMFCWSFNVLFTGLNQSQNGLKIGILSLILFALLVSFITFIVRPYALWVVRNTPSKCNVREVHIFVIIITTILMALACDIGGIIFLFGPYIMGLALPHGPPLGTALIERIDLVASEVLFPLLFLVEGRNMDWAAAGEEPRLWFCVKLIVLVVSVTKVVTLAAAAVYCNVPVKNGLLLGLILNFRGLVEMYTLIYYKYGEVLDSATYTITMLSIVLVTAICVPLVSFFYKPLHVDEQALGQRVQHLGSHAELRLITCFFDDKPIPTLLDFLEFLSSSEAQNHTCMYALHLKELKARSLPSLISHCNEKGQINTEEMDHLHNHFIAFGQVKQGNVTVLPLTSIAPEKTMYRDVCSLILKNNTALVIVPFTRKNSLADLEARHGMSGFHRLVLEQAQCSVGIMVYHGITRITSGSHTHWNYQIGVVFLGGPDDREAVAIASRMAYHSRVLLNVFYFRISGSAKSQNKNFKRSYEPEQTLDDAVIHDLQRESIENDRLAVSEFIKGGVEQTVLAIRSLGNKYDMLIVGRRRGHSSLMINAELEEWAESPELGVIGDLLASSKYNKPANVLVVQQYSSS